MRNFSKNIVQIWGKAVHNFCTNCAQTVGLYTRGGQQPESRVHKPRAFTTVYPRLMPLLIPANFRLIVSVMDRVMPTVHTTYKENNKSKILNSYFLYTGAV